MATTFTNVSEAILLMASRFPSLLILACCLYINLNASFLVISFSVSCNHSYSQHGKIISISILTHFQCFVRYMFILWVSLDVCINVHIRIFFTYFEAYYYFIWCYLSFISLIYFIFTYFILLSLIVLQIKSERPLRRKKVTFWN